VSPARSIWDWDRSVISPCEECILSAVRSCAQIHRWQPSHGLPPTTVSGSWGASRSLTEPCVASRPRNRCGVRRTTPGYFETVFHRSGIPEDCRLDCTTRSSPSRMAPVGQTPRRIQIICDAGVSSVTHLSRLPKSQLLGTPESGIVAVVPNSHSLLPSQS
jgi:hypothetical protein